MEEETFSNWYTTFCELNTTISKDNFNCSFICSCFAHLFEFISLEENLGSIFGLMLLAENWRGTGLGQWQWADFLKKVSSKAFLTKESGKSADNAIIQNANQQKTEEIYVWLHPKFVFQPRKSLMKPRLSLNPTFGV